MYNIIITGGGRRVGKTTLALAIQAALIDAHHVTEVGTLRTGAKSPVARRVRDVEPRVQVGRTNYKAQDGTKGRKWRIDLALFLNGIPIVTIELKSEFKQAAANAVTQYKKDRHQ